MKEKNQSTLRLWVVLLSYWPKVKEERLESAANSGRRSVAAALSFPNQLGTRLARPRTWRCDRFPARQTGLRRAGWLPKAATPRLYRAYDFAGEGGLPRTADI